MVDILSIKIKIGDREYPMKVKPEEEQRVRNAGKAINEKLRSFRDQSGHGSICLHDCKDEDGR